MPEGKRTGKRCSRSWQQQVLGGGECENKHGVISSTTLRRQYLGPQTQSTDTVTADYLYRGRMQQVSE